MTNHRASPKASFHFAAIGDMATLLWTIVWVTAVMVPGREKGISPIIGHSQSVNFDVSLLFLPAYSPLSISNQGHGWERPERRKS